MGYTVNTVDVKSLIIAEHMRVPKEVCLHKSVRAHYYIDNAIYIYIMYYVLYLYIFILCDLYYISKYLISDLQRILSSIVDR